MDAVMEQLAVNAMSQGESLEKNFDHVTGTAQPGSGAASASLSRAQGMALLKRLAEDDVFRALYAADPASALVLMGVEAQTVAMLDRKCLRERQLATKQVFAALLNDVGSAATCVAMSMEVPTVSIR
jgi:putative modified peptide